MRGGSRLPRCSPPAGTCRALVYRDGLCRGHYRGREIRRAGL